MPTTLIHQPLVAAKDHPSPFDVAIRKIVTGHDVVLAAPYLAWEYLDALVVEARSWRLLTDVQEWLSSEREPRDAVAFLTEHQERIHHCPDLHAKVVASREQALIGSANLTRKGLTRRQEMGVLLNDTQALEQLLGWFEGLWQVTASPRPEELLPFIEAIPPRPPATDSRVRLWSPYRAGRTRLVTPLRARDEDRTPPAEPGASKPLVDTSQPGRAARPPEAPDTHLIHRIRELARSRREAEALLDLVAWPLHVRGVTGEDPRVVVSVPRGDVEISVHFNAWQVVSWKAHQRLSLLLQEQDFPELPTEYVSRTTALRDGPYQWHRFPWTAGQPLPGRVVSSWRQSFGEAIAQGAGSMHRRWHHRGLAAALVDKAAREALLEMTFPS